MPENNNFKLSDLSPYLEGAFLAESLQDWDQTSKFLRKGQAEADPLLGQHPSESKMTGFGTIMDLAQYAGYQALPDKWKFPYTLASALGEGFNVNRNKDLMNQNNAHTVAPGHERNKYSYNVPLLGLGGLITYFLAKDWNDKHKDSKLNSFINLEGKTPVAGVTLKW